MRWLLYYELRKTRASKVILGAVMGTLEVVYLLAMLTRDKVAAPMSGILLVIAGAGGTLYLSLESVLALHRDLRTEQGVMVFMTPHGCRKILGAKMLQTLISLAVAGGVFVGLAWLDVTLALHRFSKGMAFWETGDMLVTQYVNPSLSYRDGTLLMSFFAVYVANWLNITAMAFLADIVAVSVMPGSRRSGFLAFAVFAVLGFLTLWVQTALPALPRYRQSLLLASGVALAQAAVMYVAGAALMSKRRGA